MKKWIETLSTGQKILIRTFFGLLGMTLLVMVFYAGGLEMLLLTDKKTDWTANHSIFYWPFQLLFSKKRPLIRVKHGNTEFAIDPGTS